MTSGHQDDQHGEAARARAAAFEAQAVVDRELIAQLQAESVIAGDLVANLQEALITCRRIGTAVGIVMAVMKLSEDQAFDTLRRASQRQHRKLRDIADDVVLTGTVE